MDTSLKQTDRLTELVEDLLDVSRIQVGKLEFTFQEVEVGALLDEVLARYCDALEAAKCLLDVEVAPGFKAFWDRSRIEQVIVNLLSNSIKYAPGKPIHIRADAQGERAILSVQDFGPGIPKERHAKIFQRFERATSSRNISGLGLGLFIVNEIVKGHQGSIRVESEPGKGATFIVELPLRPKTQDQSHHAQERGYGT